MKNPYKTLSSQVVYQNPWITVREDAIVHPDGRPGIYGVVAMAAPSVFVVAVNEARQVYLIRQFRYPTQHLGWEVPAGGVDVGETVLAAAKRELLEEAGLRARTWTSLGTQYCFNGILNATTHIYLAQRLQPNSAHQPPTAEGIDAIIKVSLQTIPQLITDQKIMDAESSLALLLAMQHLGL